MRNRIPLEERVAIVTGAGRGIGAETAKLLAEKGVKVVLAARTTSELKAVAKAITAKGGDAQVFKCDIADERSIKKLFAFTQKTFGAVGILVNNAAMINVKAIIKTTSRDWDQIQAVNVRGSFICSREALLQMGGAQKGGVIVNMSSLGGLRGYEKFEGFSAYSVSKHAMVGLTECLAVEGKKYGVRAVCVAPGAVDTKMLKQAAPFLRTKTTAEDIARVIVSLCDDEVSGCVTGSVLEIQSNA